MCWYRRYQHGCQEEASGEKKQVEVDLRRDEVEAVLSYLLLCTKPKRESDVGDRKLGKTVRKMKAMKDLKIQIRNGKRKTRKTKGGTVASKSG